MPTAGTVLALRLGSRRRARRFTYRVGEGLQVITSRTTTGRLDRESDDLPTARRGQPIRVCGTQVVAVWLHISGQWTEDGGRVGVDVREREDGGLPTSGTGTASNMAHSVRLYAFAEGHASTAP